MSRFLLIVSLIFLLAGCITLYVTTSEARAKLLVEQSEKAFREKNWTLARIDMKERLKRDPKNKALLFKLGFANHLLGKFGEAREAFEASRDGVTYPNSLIDYNIACTYAREAKKVEMLKTLNRALDEGFRSRETIIEDSDFASYRSDPQLRAIIHRLGGPNHPPQ